MFASLSSFELTFVYVYFRWAFNGSTLGGTTLRLHWMSGVLGYYAYKASVLVGSSLSWIIEDY